MGPLISVVLPVYNCEAYVSGSVNSILGQSFGDFELLIIDDASTDATIPEIKTISDDRIRLIEKERNSGYTDSLNLGISMAKGKYIARMDGDDISLPERFSRQVDFLESHPDVILCGTAFRILGTPTVISVPETHEQIKAALLKASCFAHPSVMVRKSALERLSLVYDKQFEPAEDYDLWTRLVGFGKLHNLQEVLLEYRIHENQVSNTRAEKQKEGSVHARMQMLDYLDHGLTSGQRAAFRKILAKLPLDYADIESFLQSKTKLLRANHTGFFNDHAFGVYLDEIERRVVRHYFLLRTKYRPYIYWQYCRLHKRLSHKLSRTEIFKLFVKAFIFHHVRKS